LVNGADKIVIPSVVKKPLNTWRNRSSFFPTSPGSRRSKRHSGGEEAQANGLPRVIWAKGNNSVTNSQQSNGRLPKKGPSRNTMPVEVYRAKKSPAEKRK